MSADDLEKMVQATKELKELQETPDSPEALACVPTLAIGDIPKEAKGIPSDVSSVGATKLLTHDLFTNDILYAEHLLDLKTVPAHLLPLVPLWTRALGRMGTKTKSFVEFDQLISAQTGGISVSPFTSVHAERMRCKPSWSFEARRRATRLVSCTNSCPSSCSRRSLTTKTSSSSSSSRLAPVWSLACKVPATASPPVVSTRKIPPRDG